MVLPGYRVTQGLLLLVVLLFGPYDKTNVVSGLQVDCLYESYGSLITCQCMGTGDTNGITDLSQVVMDFIRDRYTRLSFTHVALTDCGNVEINLDLR